MNKPPDDPGGHDPLVQEDVPQVSQYVTIEDSSVDTDASLSVPSANRKRSLTSHKCKHCNKRRKKRKGDLIKATDCQCSTPESGASQSIDKDAVMTDPQQSLPQNSSVTDTPKQFDNSYRTQYENTDVAPYVVHIQKKSLSPSDNTVLHPVSFGRFLKKNIFRSIINGSLKKIGRNRLSLSFSNYTDANIFINSPSLLNNNYKVFIPSFHITRVGLIRGVPLDWTPEDIISNINVPIGCGQIMKVRRLNRKVKLNENVSWKPTESVVVTFDGQVLPKRVFACYTSLPVELYIFPTIQCYKCCRYGHTKINCRSNPRCFKCGNDHFGESCTADEECRVSCCLCKGSHFATSNSCPEYLRQKNIKSFMAQNCVSYAEASKNYPLVTKSYVDIVTSTPEIGHNYRQFQSKILPQEQSKSQSYKKTVFLKPKSTPKISKGYDYDFHNSVIQEYNINTLSNNNGSLIKKNTDTSQEEVTINTILSLIQLLSQSQLITPDNAAFIKDRINSLIIPNDNNGQTTNANPTMELSKH